MRGHCLDRGGHSAAVDVGHSEIRNDERERGAVGERGGEGIDTLLAAVGDRDDVAVLLQDVPQRFCEHRVIVHQQDPQAGQGLLRTRTGAGGRHDRIGHREDQAHESAAAHGTLDLELRAVTLHHAVDHGEPEARAALPLRGVEGLEASAPRLLVHADAGVGDFHLHLPRDVAAARHEPRAQGKRPAFRHGVHGVEDQIGERVADLDLRAHDVGQVLGELGLELNEHSALLRLVAPAGAREVDDLVDEAITLDARQHQLGLARPVELAHARDRLRHVLDRGSNGAEIFARVLAQPWLALEQRLGVESDRRDGIVDVVRNAARHLAERAQALLLHHRLLRLAQVVVGALQRAVQLGLMGRERDVLAQLPQELTLGAAEGLGGAARRNQHPEDPLFDEQRSDHERPEARLAEALRKREADLTRVRLVDELSPEATRQSVLIERHLVVLGEAQSARALRALRPDHRDGQGVGARLAYAHAAEIDRQILLQVVQHDPEQARQVVTRAGRVRDPVQQIEPAQLALEPRLIALDARQHVVEGVGQLAEFLTLRSCGTYGIVASLGDLPRRCGERQDRFRDHPLQASRDQVGGGKTSEREQRADAEKELEVLVDLTEIRLEVESSHAPPVLHDGLHAAQEAKLEAVAVVARRGRSGRVRGGIRVGSHQASVVQVQPCCHDVRLRLQGRQHLARIARVVEGERRRAVRGDRLAENLEVAERQLPEGQVLVGEERGGGDEHDRSAGEQDDGHESAADRACVRGHGSSSRLPRSRPDAAASS